MGKCVANTVGCFKFSFEYYLQPVFDVYQRFRIQVSYFLDSGRESCGDFVLNFASSRQPFSTNAFSPIFNVSEKVTTHFTFAWKGKNFATIFLIPRGRILFIAHKRLTRKSNIIWNLNWISLPPLGELWTEEKGKAKENICRSELVIQLALTRVAILKKKFERSSP